MKKLDAAFFCRHEDRTEYHRRRDIARGYRPRRRIQLPPIEWNDLHFFIGFFAGAIATELFIMWLFCII